MTVTSRDSTSGQARRFLLGQLSPADAERFEETILASGEQFAEVESAEDDLFDAFARGELNPGDRAAFRQRYGSQPQRIRFARALDAKGRRHNVVPLPAAQKSWQRTLLAVAASIVVVAGSLFLWRTRNVPTPATTSATSVLNSPSVAVTTATGGAPAIESQSPAAGIVLVDLAMVSARGANRMTHVALTSTSAVLALRIRINPADHFPAYAITVRTSDGSSVWQGQANVTSSGSIAAEISAPRFRSGEYEIKVAGVRPGAPDEDLGFQSIIIDRPASSQ
jgi:hypothetical protein